MGGTVAGGDTGELPPTTIMYNDRLYVWSYVQREEILFSHYMTDLTRTERTGPKPSPTCTPKALHTHTQTNNKDVENET